MTTSSGGPTDVRENRVGPSPGEPDAGDPPVRFGRGSGESDRHSYLICDTNLCGLTANRCVESRFQRLFIIQSESLGRCPRLTGESAFGAKQKPSQRRPYQQNSQTFHQDDEKNALYGYCSIFSKFGVIYLSW